MEMDLNLDDIRLVACEPGGGMMPGGPQGGGSMKPEACTYVVKPGDSLSAIAVKSDVSMGELAGIVREFLPDADIRFKEQTGGRALSGNFMIDNRRLVEEFGLQMKPLRQRVKEVINDIRPKYAIPSSLNPFAFYVLESRGGVARVSALAFT